MQAARLLILTALTLSLAAAVTAEESVIENILVTATRTTEIRAGDAFSLSAVGRDDIEMVGHSHVEEILARVPGVWISRGNGQEHLTAIRSPVLTGPGSCGSFYVAEDGIPVRAPGFCNVNQLFDINTEQAGSIEVLRGPGTAVHGGNALNGVINVISPRADEQNNHIIAEYGAEAFRRLSVDIGTGAGRTALRLNAHGSRENGYKSDSGYDQQKMRLQVQHQGDEWTARAGLSASNLNQETAGFIIGHNSYRDPVQRDTNPNPEAFRETRSTRGNLRLSRSGADGSELVINPYFRVTDMRFLQHFLPRSPLEENRQTSVGLQTAFYRGVAEGVRLYHGFDLDLTKAALEQSQQRSSVAVFPTGQHYDFRVDAWNAAWFAGATWTKGNNQYHLGGRYEIQDYDYDNRMTAGSLAEDGSSCQSMGMNAPCRYSRPADRKDRFHNRSWFASATHNINSDHRIRVTASQGFRAPQATELYRLQNGQQRAKLDSESLANVELGIESNFGNLSTDIVLWYYRKNNVILQDADRNVIDDGKTRHRGMDLSADWRLHPQWLLKAAWGIASHQYANDVLPDRLNPALVASVKGNDIDTAPRQQGSLALQWLPREGTRLEAEWRHTGRYYLEPTNTESYPGHNLYNLRLRQQLGKAWLGLRWLNITDSDYAERADFAFNNYRYFTGEPRRLFAEAGLAF